jgi:integrase
MAKRERLTKRLVDGLKSTPSEFTVWDTEVKRFGIRVRPEGGRFYVLRLRVTGRQRWYTIGRHGDPWTPETARDEASRVLGQSEHVRTLREMGQAPSTLKHPVEAREQGKATPTLAEFAKRYLTEYAEPHKKARTVAEDRGLLGLRPKTDRKHPRETRTLLEALGKLRLDGITRSDVTRFHLRWQDTPTRANRGLALLSHMLTMAEKWGLRPEGSNPCRHVPRFDEPKRERYLSAQELARLGKALDALEKLGKKGDDGGESRYAVAAIRLLVFTGCRLSEVLTLRWQDVDLKAGLLRLSDSKTGSKEVIVNAPARELLSALPPLERNPYVVVGRLENAHLSTAGLEQAWWRIRDRADLPGVRLHDLRRSFASVAAGGGQSLPVIGALLGHTQAATTQRYAHLAADPLRQASEAIGKRLSAAMSNPRTNASPADNAPARRRRRVTK